MRAVPTEPLLGAIARGWCHPANSHKQMDADLANAIADEVNKWLAAAPSIAEHLFVDQRGDGIWLVCVEKVHKSLPDAQAACRKWIDRYAIPQAAALQSSDEPVAWFYTTGLGVNAEMSNNRFSHGPKRPDERAGWIPLYATPPRKP